MGTVRQISAYTDERGNRIEFVGSPITEGVRVTFRGANNCLRVGETARIKSLILDFDRDNGVMEIGGSSTGRFAAAARVGQDSMIQIGNDVTCTHYVTFTAQEGASIRIGDDVMFSSENQVRTDDAHPIFDVRTGKRVNVSRDIRIGDHVWLGLQAFVLGGARIGEGSVVGTRSLVTGEIPNNCVAAGIPARVIRRDIAWERPHLSLQGVAYKIDDTTIEKSRFWNLTDFNVE